MVMICLTWMVLEVVYSLLYGVYYICTLPVRVIYKLVIGNSKRKYIKVEPAYDAGMWNGIILGSLWD